MKFKETQKIVRINSRKKKVPKKLFSALFNRLILYVIILKSLYYPVEFSFCSIFFINGKFQFFKPQNTSFVNHQRHLPKLDSFRPTKVKKISIKNRPTWRFKLCTYARAGLNAQSSRSINSIMDHK